jgi:hypothetical protein
MQRVTAGFNPEGVKFFNTEIIPSVEEALANDQLYEVAKQVFGRNLYQKALLIFDHKIPDGASTIWSTYTSGDVVIKNPDTGTSISIKIPFVSDVATPYHHPDLSDYRYLKTVEADLKDKGEEQFLVNNIPGGDDNLSKSIATLRTDVGDFVALRDTKARILILNNQGETKAQLIDSFQNGDTKLIERLDKGDTIRVFDRQGKEYVLQYQGDTLAVVSSKETSLNGHQIPFKIINLPLPIQVDRFNYELTYIPLYTTVYT